MKTGLYLPTSDIDLVVFHNMDHTPFYEIRSELISRGICTDRTIKVLDGASVPIIKLTDQLTQVKVDIGFNIANGQRSADLVQMYIRQFPALPYLVTVLKQFLYQKELNEVYSGGISSYSLVLLTISFLQYQRVVVSVTRTGCWQEVKPWCDNARQPSLSIEDPLCSDNDVARGSYNVSRVQAAFAGALLQLLEEIYRPVYVCPSPKGMLSSIVRVPAEIERYRSWVQAKYPVSIVRSASASSPSASDREPYEISSSSSGISSASPEPRASVSCSDSLVTSDSDSEDMQTVDCSDDYMDVGVTSLHVTGSSSTCMLATSVASTAVSASETHEASPPDSVTSVPEADEIEEVGRRFKGSLFVGRDYKENPMAYNDATSSVVQCGVTCPTCCVDERAQTVGVCREQSATDTMALRHELCSCDNAAATSATESACGAMSPCCEDVVACGSSMTSSCRDSALPQPSACQMLPNDHGCQKSTGTDDSGSVGDRRTLVVDCSFHQLSGYRCLKTAGTVSEEADQESTTSVAATENAGGLVTDGVNDDSRQTLESVDCDSFGNTPQRKLLSDA